MFENEVGAHWEDLGRRVAKSIVHPLGNPYLIWCIVRSLQPHGDRNGDRSSLSIWGRGEQGASSKGARLG